MGTRSLFIYCWGEELWLVFSDLLLLIGDRAETPFVEILSALGS